MAQIIVPSVDIGNNLYGLFRPFAGSTQIPAVSVFEEATDDPETSGAAFLLTNGYRVIEREVVPAMALAIKQFNDGLYPTYMTDKGMSEAGIDAMRGVIHIRCYNMYPNDIRTVNCRAVHEMVSDLGYEFVPRDDGLES
jgi:hypothetical protein